MSSMRNAVQRRNHKERAQPLNRQKWGLLEKHKDYALRAKDHKEKRTKLKALREKASYRNPDEFYFGMLSSRMVEGGRASTKDEDGKGGRATVLSHDVAKLLKTQDAGYLRTVLQKTRKERERLEEGMQIVRSGKGGEKLKSLKGDSGKSGRHTVFVDDQKELKTFDPSTFFRTKEEDLDRSFNRRRPPALSSPDQDDLEDVVTDSKLTSRTRTPRELEKQALAEKQEKRERERRAHRQEVARRTLEAVKIREQELTTANEEVDLQRAKMNRTVGGMNKNGKKFIVMELKI